MNVMQMAILLLGLSTSLSPVLHKTFSYGKEKEEFGIAGVEKGEPLGPYSFATGGPINYIYVPDPINQNIKVISPTGNIDRTIPFDGYYDDIRVDREGNIYILDRMGQRVLVIDAAGKKITEYSIPYNIVKDPCKIILKDGEIFIKSVNHLLTNVKTKTTLPEQYEVDIKNQHLDIFIHEANNIKQIASLHVEGIVSSDFLGTDRNGNIYVQVETRNPDRGVNLIVLRFTPEGKLYGKYRIPHNDYFVWTARLLDIDDSGNIYQVLPAKDRLEINIWKTE